MVTVIRKQFGIPDVKLALEWDFENCYTNSINMLITFFLSHLENGNDRMQASVPPFAASERARTLPSCLYKKIARILLRSCAGPLATGPHPPAAAFSSAAASHPRPIPGCSHGHPWLLRAPIPICSAVCTTIRVVPPSTSSITKEEAGTTCACACASINLARRQEGEAAPTPGFTLGR